MLVIDEIESIGQQLICELDQGLRIAKGNPSAWFGGVIIILCGDFYQHAPFLNAHYTILYQLL